MINKNIEGFKSFGCAEFFEFFRNGIADGGGDFFWSDVYALIERDFRFYLFKNGFDKKNRHVVLNKIVMAIKTNAVEFIRKSAEYTEEQRNAWLVKIVKSKIKEYYRDEAIFSGKSGSISLTDSDVPIIDDKLERLEKAGENSAINGFIKFVCDIDTTPDKIIAFFFNKVIFFLRSNKFNGYPAVLSKMYNGKSLDELADFMKHELGSVLGLNIPEACFEGLDEKLNSVRADGNLMCDCEFKLTPREITDSSSWIMKKTRKSKEIIIGGCAE